MKKISLIVIALTITTSLFSQDNKIYHNFKWGFFSEYAFTPTGVNRLGVTSTYNENTFQYDEALVYNYGRYSSVSIFNFIYTFRYNLLEPSDNFGVGINTSPSLGLAITDDGFGSINIPAYLTINFGAGSTYNTASNFGGYIGVGYEFNKIGLIGGDGEIENDVWINGSAISTPSDAVPIETTWLQPTIVGGIRWWNKSNRLMELTLKYGFGTNGDLPDNAPKTDVKNPNTFQLSYGWFINY